jgi:hypothetical protein
MARFPGFAGKLVGIRTISRAFARSGPELRRMATLLRTETVGGGDLTGKTPTVR